MDIDELIDQWHNSDSDLPLHEFLGWSFEDYCKWVNDPNYRGENMSSSRTRDFPATHR